MCAFPFLCPWDFPGKNTEVGWHFLLQGIFPTEELNSGLLHCRQILYQLSYKGIPYPHWADLNWIHQLSHLSWWFHNSEAERCSGNRTGLQEANSSLFWLSLAESSEAGPFSELHSVYLSRRDSDTYLFHKLGRWNRMSLVENLIKYTVICICFCR